MFGSREDAWRLFEELRDLRDRYPICTRIRLEKMDDPYAPVPAGTEGTVVGVDAGGNILMDWDNGRSLSLIEGVDSFYKI